MNTMNAKDQRSQVPCAGDSGVTEKLAEGSVELA